MRRRSLLLALAAPAGAAAAGVRVLPERLAMPGLDRERGLRLVLPPSYDREPARRYPVLYLHDGQNLFDEPAVPAERRWGVDTALEALAARTGFEAIAVGIDHGGERRLREMTLWPHPRVGEPEGAAYLDFIVRVVKPHVDARWRTREDAASTLIGGSSMGGLVSHVAIHRHPDVFGRALVFSPAYWIAPAFDDWARERPLPRGARVLFHVGGRESERMVPDAQRVQALLAAQGTAASTLRIEPQARHDERTWRAAFEPAVRWLFEIG